MIVTKGMFDKTFDIDIEGIPQKITLKPLPARMLGKLMTLSNDLQIKTTGDEQEDGKQLLELMSNPEVSSRMLELIEATITRSYPEWDKDMVNDFVTVNMFKLLPLVIQVNLRTDGQS